MRRATPARGIADAPAVRDAAVTRRAVHLISSGRDREQAWKRSSVPARVVKVLRRVKRGDQRAVARIDDPNRAVAMRQE